MFMKIKYLIFLPTLILGTMITISASSWFSAWLGLEMNLMSMAPILINKFSAKSIEATIKYFIFQASASTLLIFFIFFFSLPLLTSLAASMSLIITSMLLLKIGMAPFQFWLPQVMACSDWPRCFILLTWQKIAPITLISFNNNLMIMMSLGLSLIIGVVGAINQTNFKTILAYSSIIHSSWMMAIVTSNSNFWVMYLLFYSLITASVILPLSQFNILSISNLHLMKKPSLFKTAFFINFLSLAGMPPMLGFTLKLLALITLMKMNFSFLMLIILITSSLVSFYFYLRTTYSSFFNSNWMPQFFSFTSSSSYWLMLFPAVSILGNAFLPFLIVFT